MLHCYGDGTFSTAPTLFYQIYVVLARLNLIISNLMDQNNLRRGKWVFPVFYALLSSKSEATYERMFRMIKDLWPNFSPQKFTIDFEKGAKNAIETIFVGCQINYCFFHFVKNFKKKLAESNLIQVLFFPFQ